MTRPSRRRGRNFNDFIMFPRKALRHEDWKGFSPAAKILYLYLKGRFNGHNNGDIHLHYSELKGVKGLSSPSSISRGFKELEEKEWVSRTRIGGLHRYSNKFELTGKVDDYLSGGR